ncbi:MAG: TonB-dependent receptor plug domain-containing protein, partial [Inhella sp.]
MTIFSPHALAAAAAALLSLSPQVVAQPAPAAATVATATAGVLYGQVSEARRGVHLAGALVRVGRQQAHTDANGQFRISGLPAGQHRLVIEFLGYQPYSAAVSISGSAATQVDVALSSSAPALARVELRAQRDAQAMALNQQRASGHSMNVVSADLLGRFPDNNMAESTQRIPGVSIERDQGEGRYITVRGAPKEYTTVSLNGVPLANPDAASRGVELDTIPTDAIAALEVAKALTPDMDGDAIAGHVNIRSQSALDRRGMTLRASVGLGR